MRIAHALPILLPLILAACIPEPTVLGPAAIEQRDALEGRLAADPADAKAARKLAALYATHLRFDEAEEALETCVTTATLGPTDLDKLADTYEILGNQAESMRRSRSDLVSEGDALRLNHRAELLRARASHLAGPDRPSVRATTQGPGGTAIVLDDVMLGCARTDMMGSGSLGQRLAVRYFGDRLGLSTPPGPQGSRDVEYSLAEIEWLQLRTSPAGERRAWVTPAPWSPETAPCVACLRHDRCVLLGDRPEGGLRQEALDTLTDIRFELRPKSPGAGSR